MHTSAQVRETLDRLARERGISCRALSLAIRRNPAYVQQFITRGSPARLEPQDRRVIASMLGVDEGMLGASGEPHEGTGDLLRVKRLSVEASAGPGALVDDEASAGRFGFDRAWLKRLTSAKPEQLSLIHVKGDSMAPTLADGDDLLVDHSQADPRRRDGVYVLRRDDTLMVKRLALAPTSATVTISSDNPAYPTWHDCPLTSITVVGRAIWASRQLG